MSTAEPLQMPLFSPLKDIQHEPGNPQPDRVSPWWVMLIINLEALYTNTESNSKVRFLPKRHINQHKQDASQQQNDCSIFL